MNLNEVQVLKDIILSESQKYILAKIVVPNSTPLLAYEEIMHDENLVENAKILEDLGLIHIDGKELSITETGLEAMREERLIDEFDELTEDGNSYAYADDYNDIEKVEKTPETSDQLESASGIEFVKKINEDANCVLVLSKIFRH